MTTTSARRRAALLGSSRALGSATLRLAFLGVTVATLAVLMSQEAGAADPPPPTAQVAISPAEIKLKLADKTDPNGKVPGYEVGTGTVVLSNSGTADGTVTFKAAVDREHDNCTSDKIGVQPADAITVARGGVVSENLTVTFPAGCAGETGSVLVKVTTVAQGAGQATVAANPATTRFSGTKDFTESELWFPVIAAAVLSVLFLVIMFARLLLRGAKPGAPVYVQTSWSFKDSWVTNISTVGGVLVTVLAATGFLQIILPGRVFDRVIGLNIVFTTLTLLGPVMYTAAGQWRWTSTKDKDGHEVSRQLTSDGTVWGIVLAGAVTLAGVDGQLATLAVIDQAARGGDSVKNFLLCGIVATSFFVFWYAVAFTYGITTPDDEEKPAVAQPRSDDELSVAAEMIEVTPSREPRRLRTAGSATL